MTTQKKSAWIVAAAMFASIPGRDSYDAGVSPDDEQSASLSKGPNEAENRVEICHKTGSQGYKRTFLRETAVKGHLAHGDGFVGDPVPNQGGMEFDALCRPIGFCPAWTIDEVAQSPAPTLWVESRAELNEGSTMLVWGTSGLAREVKEISQLVDWFTYQDGEIVKSGNATCAYRLYCREILRAQARVSGLTCTDGSGYDSCNFGLPSFRCPIVTDG